VANKVKNHWSYELFSPKEEILSVNSFSKAKYFSLYINEEFQATFEFPSKISSADKQSLLKYHSKTSLTNYRKEQNRKIFINEDDIYNDFLTEFEADRKQEIVNRKAREKEERLIKKKLKEIIKKEEEEKEYHDHIRRPEKITKIRDLELPFESLAKHPINSRVIGLKNKYSYESVFFDLFDMEKQEKEFITLINENIDIAVSKFKEKFPYKRITNFYVDIAVTKHSDQDFIDYISTGFRSELPRETKDAVKHLVTQFNKDKTVKEKYGEVFINEVLSSAKVGIHILWNLV